MKRKLLSFVLFILSTVFCALGFVACNKAYNVTFIADGATYATVEVKVDETITPPPRNTHKNEPHL